VLALLDLGRTDEAKGELETALKTDPRNLALLSGAAYWFAAHNDSEMAFQLGSKAVEIEPRYTWSQVALARALIAQKRPLEAERAIRFARLYGKFPTLEYELASALVSSGLYDEAAEILLQSFSLKDGQVETRLGGHAFARSANFTDLLAPERRASIFQFAAADSENNAKTLKALLTFASLINQEDGGGRINEESAIAAAKEFASGDDDARVHRQLYAASRLIQKGIGFQTAHELAEAARSSADAGMNVPALTVVIQADEYREIRARAISAGGTPDIPEAPRNVLSNILRGRIEDLSGWALFNQDKLDEAVDHLRRAISVLPEGTPASRTSLWHLGAALERVDKKEEALSYYIKSYNAGEPDSVRRTVIERLYRQLNGSLSGLDERIGSAAAATAAVSSNVTNETTPVQPSPSPESTPTETPTAVAPVADASATPLPDAPVISKAEPSPSPEVLAPPTPEPSPVSPPSPAASPEATPDLVPAPASSPEPSPSPSPAVTPGTPPVTSPSLAASPVETMNEPPATVVTIKGRVKDASNSPMANVVVVLISPQGTVLASTTDEEGNYLFTVAPSTHGYRVIPSKDGFTFQPADRVLPDVSENQKDMDFIGATSRTP
jgi:tetratricopeptide (TPR) repeat protein